MASSSTSVPAVAKPDVPKTNKTKKDNRKFLFELGVEGSPSCLGVMKTDLDERLKQFQDCVGGFFEPYPKQHLRLHPMFLHENLRWRLASRLLAIAEKVYVNENGMNECSVNVATLNTNPYKPAGSCPHLFGNVLLVVSESKMAKAGISHLPLVVVEEFEPEDTDDEDAKKAECVEKGYDYIASSGQIFLRPV